MEEKGDALGGAGDGSLLGAIPIERDDVDMAAVLDIDSAGGYRAKVCNECDV